MLKATASTQSPVPEKYLNAFERRRVLSAAATLAPDERLFVLTLAWTGRSCERSPRASSTRASDRCLRRGSPNVEAATAPRARGAKTPPVDDGHQTGDTGSQQFSVMLRDDDRLWR